MAISRKSRQKIRRINDRFFDEHGRAELLH
jgi:hypothetical protein